MIDVVEYTDPWCSWAWGTEPKLRRLRWRYGDRFRWRTVLGDLVPEREGVDLEKVAPEIAGYWQKVSKHTGMPWPEGLRWAPGRSQVADKAVIAARAQGAEGALLRRIRESCFIDCAPADTKERILALDVPGVDMERLGRDMDSDEVAAAFAHDREETRNPNRYVLELQETHEGKGNARKEGERWRYVFPTLLFRGDGEHTVPGWQLWERYLAAMEAAEPGSTVGGRPDPTPEEARAAFAGVTDDEVRVICGA